ncbi:hypothetical protein CH373_08935 [Leptospira perolatii]|uniref:Uncharacterized protein n=1 Tax=Leptospira perolatii TaxID=2023191 RepID=A0A2M9ZNH1_9LEPT|nr:hypothetical protein [Leptospira perolatii]PJZ69620.1 hypothetical protein CH360_10080 [Leptospira perolatii]PJZ73607.1 hypothetical protein CH373_08935 [Leptospira perolatii]
MNTQVKKSFKRKTQFKREALVNELLAQVSEDMRQTLFFKVLNPLYNGPYISNKVASEAAEYLEGNLSIANTQNK